VIITEIRIKPAKDNRDWLLGFASVTFDRQFTFSDIKIIKGKSEKGNFLGMPSRKLEDRCPNCGEKNHLRARYCNGCGYRLDENRVLNGQKNVRANVHVDVAHPIHSEFRHYLQSSVIEAYNAELERSRQPGYRDCFDFYWRERELPRMMPIAAKLA
jgi:stage V sporulation protein G